MRRADHCRFRLAPRKQSAPQAQLRHRHGAYAVHRALHRGAARRRRRLHARGTRLLVGRGGRRSIDAVRARADERRRSALSSLYQRHDGQAEGHQAHDRRIFDPGGNDPQARLRLEGRARRLLVHGRHRMGHRTLVHRLRTVGQRRDQRHVRRHAGFPDKDRFWEIVERYRRDDPLHRADRDSYLHEVGHGISRPTRSLVAAAARHCRRTDQSRSVDLVSRMDRRKPHPGRRHVVADRNGRYHDRAVTRRDDAASGQRDETVAGHRGRHRQRSRRIGAAGRRRLRRPDAAVAGNASRHLGRRRALRANLLVDGSRTYTLPATADAATPKATIGSWAASTT